MAAWDYELLRLAANMGPLLAACWLLSNRKLCLRWARRFMRARRGVMDVEWREAAEPFERGFDIWVPSRGAWMIGRKRP